jgi:hypothetical protein
MKKILLIALLFLAAAGIASAQIYTPTTDVLGAHLNYGNAGAADPTSGNIALWGEDVSSLYGKTITTGQSEHGSYVEVLPTAITAGTPDVAGVLMCLSCHDGNYATGAMMQNKVYETLPASYGTKNAIPTLMGNDGTTTGNYLNDHPVGLNAVMGCGGPYDWDCSIDGTGKVLMTGPNSAKFITNYGFFVSPKAYNNQPTVMCTTCHNQHLMNVVKVKTGATTGLPSGTYATMFFIRAPYNPASGTAGSNQTAQFCRQCHGGEANEMNGSTAITTF